MVTPPDDPRALPRSVGAARAVAWYGDALRWVKVSPGMLLMLASLTVVAEVLLQSLPVAGVALAKVLTPLLFCGLFAACDRVAAGGKAQLSDALAGFRISAGSMAAVVLVSLIEFFAEAALVYGVTGINLLADNVDARAFTTSSVLAMFAVGMVVSLPFTLTPFYAVLDDAGFSDSLRPSVQAFNANIGAFALYGVLSYALLIVGVALMGIGVVLVMPLWVLAAYSALRDIYPRS